MTERKKKQRKPATKSAAEGKRRSAKLKRLQTNANRARESYDYSAAIRLYTKAIDQAPTSDPLWKYDLLSGRALCYWRLGDFRRASDDLALMATLAEEAGDTEKQVEALARRSQVAYSLADRETSRELARQAMSLVETGGTPQSLAWAHGAAAAAEYFMGDIALAQAYVQKAMEEFYKLGESEALVTTLINRSYMEGSIGESAKAYEYVSEAVKIARRINFLEGEAFALRKLGVDTNDFAQSRALREESLRIYGAIGDMQGQGIQHNNLGLLYAEMGLFDTARIHLEESVQMQRAIGDKGALSYTLESLGRVLLDLGEPDTAQDALEEGLALIREIGNRVVEGVYLLTLGRLELARGQPEEARSLLKSALGIFESQSQAFLLAYAQAWMGRAWQAVGDLDAAEEWTARAVQGLSALGDISYDFDPQHVYWIRYELLRGSPPPLPMGERGPGGEGDIAWQILNHAYELTLQKVANLSDAGLRRNYLNKVEINRRIYLEWVAEARQRGLTTSGYEVGVENIQEGFRRLLLIGLRMNESRSEDGLVSFIMNQLVELTGAERTMLVFLDEKDRPHLRSSGGFSTREKPLEIAEDTLLEVRRVQRPVLHGVSHPSDHDDAEVDEDKLSIMGAPLIAGGRLLGMIYVDVRAIFGPFSQGDLDLLSAFANQAATALDNARLYEGLEQKVQERTTELQVANDSLVQRASELAIINSVGQALASKLDFQGIVDIVGEKIAEIFNADTTFIALYDSQTDLVSAPYYVEKGYRHERAPIPLGPGFVSKIIRTGESLRFGTMEEQDLDGSATPMVSPGEEVDLNESFLGVPIFSGEQVLGVVSVQKYQQHAFNESDERLLSTLAASMSVALENARLFDETNRLLEETQQRAAELAIINSVGEAMSRQLDVATVTKLVGDEVQRIFHTETCMIILHDRETNYFTFPYAYDRGAYMDFSPIPFGQGVSTQIVKTRKPMVYGTLEEGLEKGAAFTQNVDGTPIEECPQSFLGVPIIIGNKVLGVITVQSYQQNAFREDDVRLLSTLSSNMAVAIENARLFQETEQRAAELGLINSVQEGLAAQLDYQSIIDLVGDKIQEVFDAQAVMIVLVRGDTHHYPYIIERGVRLEQEPTRQDTHKGFGPHVMKTRQPLMINENLEAPAPEYGSEVVGGGEMSRSAIWVPLVSGNQAQGFLSIQNVDRENAFSEADLRLLTTLAASMSVALENARLFEETNRLLEETEQRAAELAVINSVQQGLASKLDPKGIFDLVGDTIHNIFNAQGVLLGALDQETGLASVNYLLEKGERFYPEPVPFTDFMKHVIETRETVVINRDLDKQAEKYGMKTLAGQKIKSGVWVPLLAGDEVRGIISLQNIDQEDAFPESDVRLLTTLASSMSVALENARLYQETQRRASEMSALTDIGREISATLDLPTVLERISTNAHDLLAAQTSAVILLEEDGRTLKPIAVVGENLEEIKAFSWELGKGIIGSIAKSGQSEIVQDASTDPRAVHIAGTGEDEEGEKLIVAPLFTRDKVTGAMAVWRSADAPVFSQEELNFLTGLSRQAEIAIENARLFREAEQRVSELATINIISEGLLAQQDLESVVNLVGENVRQMFTGDFYGVALYDQASELVSWPYGYLQGEPLSLGSPALLGKGATSHVIRTGEPLLCLNVQDYVKHGGSFPEVLKGKEPDELSWLGIPVKSGSQVLGVIFSGAMKANAYVESDLRLLATIAANLGIAISNARLLEETRRRADEMAVLAEVGREVSATLDLPTVLERIASHARGLLVADTSVVYLREDSDETLRAIVALGDQAEAMKEDRIVLGKGIIGDLASRGAAEVINDVNEDPRARHVPGTPDHASESLMATPLITREGVVGVMAVWRIGEGREFSIEDLNFLTGLARQGAIAIQNAGLFDEVQNLAREAVATNEVLRIISRSPTELQSKLDAVAEYAARLCDADDAFILRVGENEMVPAAKFGMAIPIDPDARVPLDRQTVGGRAILDRKPVQVNDIVQEPEEEYGRAKEMNAPLDIHTILSVPLLVEDKPIGAIVIRRLEVRLFSDRQINLLQAFADQAAISIENARLFDEVQRQRDYSNSLVENSPVAIITTDLDANVVSWNPAAEQLFGYSPEEAIGSNVDKLIAKTAELLEEALSYNEQASHGVLHSVTQRSRKDGSLVDVDLSGVPVFVDGKPVGLIALYHDITERVRAEQELQRQKEYVEAVLENSPVAIVTVDRDFRVVSWNPAAEKLFGYTKEEAIGKDAYQLHSIDKEILKESTQYGERIAAGERVQAITQRNRKGGGLVDVEILGLPVLVDGERVGNVIIYHDITELLQAQREAEAANQAKSAFLATMSHEIRTPMNAVIGMSSLLLDTGLNTDQREFAEIIRNSGDDLLTIINDILDFSKIEADRMELEYQPFDLRECIEGTLDLVAPRGFEKGLDLAYLIEEGTPLGILGDVTRLRQVLLNLLTNAVKFTEHGEVVLTVSGKKSSRKRGKYELHFRVRDTGIGIPADRMDRLFKSFSQLDASTARKYGGSGLGLAISKRLSEMMGGTMWAESAGEPGQGSTFHFTVIAEPAEVPQVQERDLNSAQPLLVGKKVLIVDDNNTNRRILELQTKAWGMESAEFASARDALDALRDGDKFDIAILDMHMPEMDGVGLAEEIRKIHDETALPLILFTSLGRKEVGVDEIRFAAHLTKPIKPSQLFDALVAIFAEKPVQVHKTVSGKAGLDPEMARRHPLRILLAEDNTVNQKLALRILEQMGYRADVAANGLETLDAVERQRYDVVLMDVQMPEMDGLEASRQINRRWTGSDRPRIVAMTANAMQGDRELCIAAGMDDYLTKPIRVEELVAALLESESELGKGA